MNEPLRGSTFIGTTVIDTLTGTAGDDVINGLGAVDSMDGKDGSDVYIITSHPALISSDIQIIA